MKRVTLRNSCVHRTLLQLRQKRAIFRRVCRIYLPRGSVSWNQFPDACRAATTMSHSSLCSNCSRGVARFPRNAGRAAIWIYRHTLSPLVGYNCRHLPTCSVYGDEAIERFGLWAGGWMTLARLLRCHPLGTSGIDNVPAAPPPGARWFLPWRYGRWRSVNAP